MARPFHIALVLSASFVLAVDASAAALAQTAQPAGTPPGTTTTTTTPTTQTQPPGTIPPGGATVQPGAATGQPGGALPPAIPTVPMTTGPGTGAPQPGANIQGGALPPPPMPSVLPAVPNIPYLSAPITAVPNGDLVGVQQQPFVGIALRDAIAMALQRNTDLALAQANRRIANYQIVAAKGAYDVNFQLVPSYSRMVEPVSSPFNSSAGGGPVTQDTAGVTAALRGLTPHGGQYSVGASEVRTDNNSVYNIYNPFYNTALQFAVTQPLGRGAAIDQPRLQIQLAQIGSQLQSANALATASNTVVQTANAYVDLVAAWQNVAIQEEGLRDATAQAQSNARLAAQGAVAPTDIVEANTQVNVFQDNVFAAIENVQRLQTQLKSLIVADPADPVWMANLVPTTPLAQIPAEPTLSSVIASAIAKRPEIAQVEAQRRQSDVNLAYARDQLKPQVDLGLGYTSNGFAGSPISAASNPLFSFLGTLVPPGTLASSFPPPPAYQKGSLGQAWTNAFDNRFPQYSAQLTFSIPIGEHTAKADVAIAQEQERQVSINETALLQRFRSEAVNAIQALREAQYRVIAARAAREASERVLTGEQRRFRAGTSTTFLVLQRQLEVAQNRGRELVAQTDLYKSIVELQRVSGDLFARNGIDVDTMGAATLNAAPTTNVLPSASR